MKRTNKNKLRLAKSLYEKPKIKEIKSDTMGGKKIGVASISGCSCGCGCGCA